MIADFAVQGAQMLIVLLMAPLLTGLVRKIKARMLRRTGPPVIQPYRDLLKLIPYKRIGEPEDIARTVVWLASDEADYITGANIYVDGGMTLYPGFEAGG